MISQDDMWRDIINGLEGPPIDDSEEPKPEKIDTEPMGVKKSDQKFFVQKIITEIYVYTDLENQQYGEMSFQDVVVMGEMPAEKMLRLFKKKRRQQEKDTQLTTVDSRQYTGGEIMHLKLRENVKMGKGPMPKTLMGKKSTLREHMDLMVGGKSKKNSKITRRPGRY